MDPAQFQALVGDETVEGTLGVEDQIDATYGLMRQRRPGGVLLL